MLNLPNQRSGKILSVLLKRKQPVVINKLAEKFDVSPRTIRSDLKKLENWVAEREVELVKKPRVGVWIEADDLERTKLEQQLFRLEKDEEPLSPAKRQQYILKILLQNEKPTVESLAQDLYVSKATIYNDLKQVKKWLRQYELILEKNSCELKLKGEEKDLRKAIADFLTEFKDTQELKQMLEIASEIEPNSRIDKKTYRQLKTLFGDVNFKKVEEILDETENKLGFSFADEAFVGLVIHIAISIERLTQNKDIKMKKEQLENLRKKEEFEVARYVAKTLEKKLEIEIPEAEIGYISLHILGAKLHQNIKNRNIADVLQNADAKVITIASDIIATAEEILGVSLKNDEQLLVGLVLHLRPAINRLKYGMSLRNPLLEKIKNNYPRVFGAAWAASVVFEEHLDIKVKEEEIGYIALHLGAALERIDKKVKIVIVCGSGVGTSQLVATKLSNRLSRVEVMDFISAHRLDDNDLKNIDLVVTTIPVEEENISRPVVKVSPLVTQNDISLIKSKIREIAGENLTENSILLENSNLERNILEISKLIEEDLIFTNLELDSKEGIIEFLSRELLKKNKVKEEFINSVLEREELTSTQITSGVAIPHGEQKYVLDSTVAIATLNKPVSWGSGEVEVVFLFALEKENGKKLFCCFHSVFEDDELLAKLKESSSKKEIKNTILKEK